jgi:hypothetical protein
MLREHKLGDVAEPLRGRRRLKAFDVRDFGMEPPRMLFLRVEPEVAVRVEIIAEREALAT